MCKKLKNSLLLFAVPLLLLLSSCATAPRPLATDRPIAYSVKSNPTLLSRYAPVFIIESPEKSYNLIGTPGAKIGPEKKEHIFIDPEQATFYVQERTFETAKGRFTNLVYRVHFKEIPGGFTPFHLGKGKNIGLLVIVTLNSQDEPILYTTVHTCGCYLAFVPTSLMPEDGLPEGWQSAGQTVYSEKLPGLLDYKDSPPDQNRAVILLRDGTHRVKDLWSATAESLHSYQNITAEALPLTSLEELPLKNHATTSFYETAGCRKGYVKNSHKIRERLLMSWWVFDWRVGEDKKFGENKNDGILFYTSLKPWDRKESDMRDFATFLGYWGWNL